MQKNGALFAGGAEDRLLPRSHHKKYDGMVFRKNDPIWRKIFPPWEFNCNCWVENSDADPEDNVMFHISGKHGTFIGSHSWVASDEEVLFDRKIKFRALKPGEPGYITPEPDETGMTHIALTEV